MLFSICKNRKYLIGFLLIAVISPSCKDEGIMARSKEVKTFKLDTTNFLQDLSIPELANLTVFEYHQKEAINEAISRTIAGQVGLNCETPSRLITTGRIRVLAENCQKLNAKKLLFVIFMDPTWEEAPDPFKRQVELKSYKKLEDLQGFLKSVNWGKEPLEIIYKRKNNQYSIGVYR